MKELCLKEGSSKIPKVGTFRFMNACQWSPGARELASKQPEPGYVVQVQTLQLRGRVHKKTSLWDGKIQSKAGDPSA